MNEIGVVWIEAAHTQIVEQICNQMGDTKVLFAADLLEIADALDQLSDGAVYLKVPLADVIPSDVLTLVHTRNPSMPILIEDLRAEHEHRNAHAQGDDIYYVFGDVALDKKISLIRTLVRSRFSAQLGFLGESVTKRPAREAWREMLIGESPAMLDVIEQIRLVAPRKSTVLITGETGTGKEVVARALHMASGRGDREMVAFNCGALPEALLEAELFGHAKGAFTGAVSHRAGRFEQAHQSTIFLDEIGDLLLDLQSKLLRVLQEREFHRLGGSETIKVDVRVVAATNLDLAEAVAKKRFREDLYYRLNVISIHLPPLRRRAGDISLLLRHFIDKLCRKEGLRAKSVSPAALERLAQYSWPGNVRQLEHATETAIVMSGQRDILEVRDFPIREPKERLEMPAPESYPALPEEGLNYEEMIARIERYVLSQALEQSRGNKSRAADLLQMKRSTLVSKLKSLDCDIL
jgi:DNA-binding NtrC family response regulator